MAIVVRLGPLPLGRRLAARTAELERIFGTTVQVIEVGSVAELVTVITQTDPGGVALDAVSPGQLAEAAAAAGRSRCYDRSGIDSGTPVVRPTRCSMATGC